MEYNSYHIRGRSGPDHCSADPHQSKISTFRRKLLEKGLKNEKDSYKYRHRLSTASPETASIVSNTPSNSSLNPSFFRGLDLKTTKPAEKNSTRALTTNSPPSTRQNTCSDSTKRTNQELYKKRKPAAQKLTDLSSCRQKPEKPTARIARVSSKFSVKKINDLSKSSCRGDELLCRSLLAILSEVDYHIKESQDFPIDDFYEYIECPGIAVQTIKRIPDYVIGDRVSLSRSYIGSYRKAIELFNEVDCLSANAGISLLAELLEEIFTFKGLEFNRIGVKAVEEKNYRQHSFEANQDGLQTHRRIASHSEFINQIFPADLLKQSISLEKEVKPNHSFSHCDLFSKTEGVDSKSFLLSKFFTKMGVSKENIVEREKSPARNIFPLDCSALTAREYIKVKAKRASSATPGLAQTTRKSEQSLLEVNKSNKHIEQIEKIKGLRQRKILLGSRFYKKIDEKFVETLAEKIRKEPIELKKLKSINFEEYLKKKNQYLIKNKPKWVSETLKILEASDFLAANENDLCQQEKHDSMLEHLSNKPHIDALIRKAESYEFSMRSILAKY